MKADSHVGSILSLFLLFQSLSERSGRKDATYMIEILSRRGILCESRSLALGDFMFIARHKRLKDCEVVLDTIIERKRVSDLVTSIRDGRYQEQRSRLKKTQFTRIIYLIEGSVTEQTVYGLPIQTVENVITAINVRMATRRRAIAIEHNMYLHLDCVLPFSSTFPFSVRSQSVRSSHSNH